MEALRHCDNLIDADGHALAFDLAVGKARLLLEPSDREGMLRARVQVACQNQPIEDFRCINEQFVLTGARIVEILPVGNNFASIPSFNAELQRRDLALFLILLFSYFENIDLQMEGYRLTLRSDDKIKAAPCLIFEKIGEDNALYLRVGQSLPDLDFNALEQFDLYRYAEINDLEQTVTVKFIDQAPSEQLINSILKLLRKHEPKKKSRRDEVMTDGNLLVIPEQTAAAFIYPLNNSLLLEARST